MFEKKNLPIFGAPYLGIVNKKQLILIETQTRQKRFWPIRFSPSFVSLWRKQILVEIAAKVIFDG